jgi:hypothetical protein
VRRPLLVLSAIFFLWAGIVLVTGGIDSRVAGIAIRSRDPQRALIAAVLLLVVQSLLDRKRFERDVRRVSAAASRVGPWLAAAAAIVVVFHAVHDGYFIAGGSDAYGYVSEAYGWATGSLPHASVVPLALDVPNGAWVQAPLGYKPGVDPHTIVPTYAPGLPLLMAAAIRVTGPIGPYLIVPICAGLFVWFTYLLGVRIAGRGGGVAAAALAATCPVLLFQAIAPMSDVPAGAFFTGAAALSLWPSRKSALASGLLAALGLLVRPNLLPLAVVPLIGICAVPGWRARLTRAAIFLLPVGCAALAIARLNTIWYGSPLKSGYGDADALFAFDHIVPNLRRYGAWTWQSESPGVLLALLAFPAMRLRSPQRPAIAMAWLMLTVTFLSYVAYLPFDAWWFLRFLLPGFGALLALVSVGLATIARRVPAPWGRTVAIIVLLLMVRHGLVFARSENVFGLLRDIDHRYADVGEFISEKLPDNAVAVAMQHSGTVRFYGGRMTIRWDYLDGESGMRAPRELERLGFHPYLVIDQWEIPLIERQFGLPAGERLPWPVIATMRQNGGVEVYDLSSHPVHGSPVAIQPGHAPRYSRPKPLVLKAEAAR